MASHQSRFLAGLVLLGLGACVGPQRLQTTLGGREVESLRAEARKVDGQWLCELRLPLGTWQVETAEGQSFDLVPGDPQAVLRWKVLPDRWAQQDRPFRFDLVGANGLRLALAVRYPHTLPKAAEAVLQVLRGSVGI